MLCFRGFIHAFSISIISSLIIITFIYFFPKDAPEHFVTPPDKELLKFASMLNTKPTSIFECRDITSLVGQTGLEVKHIPEEGWIQIGRKESKKSLIVLSHEDEADGCLLTFFSAVPNVDKIIGIVTANFWNKDMMTSVAFFDDEDNTLVLYSNEHVKSPEVFVNSLGAFRDQVLGIRENLEHYTKEAKPKNPA